MIRYISLDMDYFFGVEGEPKDLSIFYKMLELTKKAPTKILVEDHHHLLPHINATKPNVIHHIDYHQDISFPYHEGDDVPLNCGTFLYFVKDRKNIDFVWHYPNSSCIGPEGNGYCVDPRAKPESKKNFVFKTQRRSVRLPKISDFLEASAVGISISRDYVYVSNETLSIALDTIKSLGFEYIPIRKGEKSLKI